MTSRSTRSSKKRAASQITQATADETSKKRRISDNVAKPSHDSKSGDGDAAKAKPVVLLKIHEEIGDIFDAPDNTLIIHACNCNGSWGAGIAKAFQDRYPEAYGHHVTHCRENSFSLLASAQMIPPVDASSGDGVEGDPNDDDDKVEHSLDTAAETSRKTPRHFVGCLFTSRHYGRKKDSPAQILAATKPAMTDLLKQVDDWNAKAGEGEKIAEVRMCKINSGLFAVPWEKTKNVLTSIDVSESEVKVIKVVSLGD